LFTGSVNCTVHALQGKNIEAGSSTGSRSDVIGTYFAVDEGRPVPTELRQDQGEKESAWLTFYATDLGDAIEVVVAPGKARTFL